MPYRANSGREVWFSDLTGTMYLFNREPDYIENIARTMGLPTVPYSVIFTTTGGIWVCYDQEVRDPHSPYECVGEGAMQ